MEICENTEKSRFSLLRLRKLLRGGVSLRRLRRDQKGATAVEFGMIAVPFFMLLMSTFEMALMLWTSQQMEEATFQVSRTLLTGGSTTLYNNPGTAAQKFKDDLCAAMSLVTSCDGRLKVNVQVYAPGAPIPAYTAVVGGVLNVTGFSGTPSTTASSIVIVQTALTYPLTLSSWSKAFANIDATGTNPQRALVATLAFRAEPF